MVGNDVRLLLGHQRISPFCANKDIWASSGETSSLYHTPPTYLSHVFLLLETFFLSWVYVERMMPWVLEPPYLQTYSPLQTIEEAWIGSVLASEAYRTEMQYIRYDHRIYGICT